MSGFFSTEEVHAPKHISKMSGCGACRLNKTCLSPYMEPTGKGEKGILIIAEAPGATEDQRGVQLIGEAGQLLRKKLKSEGIDLDRDCRKTNAICCRPPDNRTPSALEVDCCRPRVWREIETYKPHLIILLGGSAVQSFLGHRWPRDLGGINKWRGWTIPDRDTQAWVAPTFHPSFLLRSEGNPAVEKVFDNDLQTALQLLDKPFPEIFPEQTCIEIISDQKTLSSKLKQIFEWNCRIAIDYETTGLKPQAEGHRIVSMSIATNENTCYSFLMPPEGRVRSQIRQILMAPEIPKMAHNIKFEDNWTNVRMPCPVESWEWDSCLAAHILDNREGITGLKFQAYVNFGLLDYSSHVEHLLKSVDGRANGFNQIDKIPVNDLLMYNGIDSLVEFRLAMEQMRRLRYEPSRKACC